MLLGKRPLPPTSKQRVLTEPRLLDPKERPICPVFSHTSQTTRADSVPRADVTLLLPLALSEAVVVGEARAGQ